MEKDLPFDRLSAVVNRPEWDVFLVWVAQEKAKCYDRLEVCKPEDLKTVQGEVNIWRQILTLRDSVSNHIKTRGTKTQF